MLSSAGFREYVHAARQVHRDLGGLDRPALETWCGHAASRMVWFANEEYGAEPTPEPGRSVETEPVVLPATRVCLGRPPQADRLAAVVSLLLHGNPDDLGELERAVLVPVERASWENAIRTRRLPLSWLQVEHFVTSGNHRVAAQVMLDIPLPALSRTAPWIWY